MFSDEFKTVETRAEAVISDRGCRFIGVIVPADTMEKADVFIQTLRQEYPDLLDCVYAVRLGLQPDRTLRSNGSVGHVILNILEAEDITNALLAVVREAQDISPKSASDQAYRDAGLNAVRRSKVVTRILYDVLQFQISRDDLETVSRLITDHRGKIIQTVSEPDLILSVKIRKIQSEALKKILVDATHGRTSAL
ncbi:YigZ family protein [bacterium]|nr:YigZ family protein [bacterium]